MGGVARTRITGIKDYYRKLTEMDIGEVARELLAGRITEEGSRLLQCDCPRHASDSKRSLHVSLDKQLWCCFACGVGGDVLQLVEFVQFGVVTRGNVGPMTDSHRQARAYLAERVGLPPLERHGLSADQLDEAEANHAMALRVFGVLTRLAEVYHERILASPEVLNWFQEKYRIGAETIASLKIGYAENDGIVKTLIAPDAGFTLRDLAASGAFRPTAQDTLDPFFEHRITFPYWSRGRVVYMIGRKTPWTPNEPYEAGKYRKLPVHNDAAHSVIAPCVSNAHLFNEDVLLGRPNRIVITEGITDCISLLERGIEAISPVTVRIREDDWERIIPKLAGVQTVYLCHDNEPSQVGLTGSLATARALRGQGIDTRVAILPLDAEQVAARAELNDRFAITPGLDSRDLKTRLDGLSDDDRTAAKALLDAAKIDVNAFFAARHTTAEFESILAAARTPIEMAIDGISCDTDAETLNRLLDPVLAEIATLDDLEQARHLKLISSRFGRAAVPIATLRKRVSAIARERRNEAKKQKKRSRHRTNAPAGSCREAIDRVFADAETAGEKPDYAKAAEAAYAWFLTHDGKFFRTRLGQPHMYFDDEIFAMDGDRDRRRLYVAKMYKHTGLVPTTAGARTFYEVLSSLVVERGEFREQLSWLHTDVGARAVYINLNNDAHEIAKVEPGRFEVVKNGANADGVILGSSYKMAPLKLVPDADLDEAERLLTDLVISKLTCAPNDRLLVVAWALSFALLDFAGTRPMMRFEGGSGSGKTTASKLISTLIYGSPQQKIGTIAANYVDASRNPMMLLDNIETRQLTDELASFILTCVTGITKEKRRGNTDSETVIEQPRCLLNTTGIEPLGGELSEALSRSFVVRFALDETSDEPFLEAHVLAEIRAHRDLIMTLIVHRTSQVLGLLAAGAQERVMKLIHTTLGSHAQRRANDFLALMYLMAVAGMPEVEIEHWLDHPRPEFFDALRNTNAVTRETGRESNQIATVLAALLHAYRAAAESDRNGEFASPTRSNAAAFRERYPLTYVDSWAIHGARARELFVVLKTFARDHGLSFGLSSVQQFAQRLTNDLKTIAAAGFDVRVTPIAGRPSLYDIVESA